MTDMENTSTKKIQEIVSAQKKYFASGATLDIAFRKNMLRRLSEAMDKWENRLCDALWADLHKSYEEAYLTEISIVKAEIRSHIRNVSGWARRKRAHSHLKLFLQGVTSQRNPLDVLSSFLHGTILYSFC